MIEDFFENINSEEKAYWLGFILADGYINASSNTVGIELKSDEYKHLEKYKNSIQYEGDIRIYNKNSTFGKQQNCRITTCNKKIKQDLLNLGLTSRKTYDGTLPKLQEDMVRHMLRGYFDGDGSISMRKNKTNSGYSINLGITSTKEICQSIELISGFSWNWSERRPERNNNNFTIGCGRQSDSRDFLDYIYKDATIYLDRKYEKYLKIKNSDK